MHIGQHLIHALSDSTVKVAALDLAVVHSETSRNGLSADGVLTPCVSSKRHVGAGRLEAGIHALILVGLHEGSLMIADAVIGAHEVIQPHHLKQLRLDGEADDGIDFTLGGAITLDSLGRKLRQGLDRLILRLGVHIGFLAGDQCGEHLNNRRGRLHAASVHISTGVCHVDFKNGIHLFHSFSFTQKHPTKRWGARWICIWFYCTRITSRAPLPM